jgi:hypothetical protein
MSKVGIFAGFLMPLAALSPAAAGQWSVGVGVGFGEPGYYGPPPVYYAAPPPHVYEQPPVVYVPPPPPPIVHSSISPDAVFDALERYGYRDFGPMAFREGVYKLNATNRRGDIVALEVSALDGQVEREFILHRRRSSLRVDAPAAPMVPRLPRAAPEPSGVSGDPLVVY